MDHPEDGLVVRALAEVREALLPQFFTPGQLADHAIWGWGLGPASALGRNSTPAYGFADDASLDHRADAARDGFMRCTAQALLLCNFEEFRAAIGSRGEAFVFAQGYANWITLATIGATGLNVIDRTGTTQSHTGGTADTALSYRERAFQWAKTAHALGRPLPGLDKFFDLEDSPRHDIQPAHHAIVWALTDCMIRGEFPLDAPAPAPSRPEAGSPGSRPAKKPKPSGNAPATAGVDAGPPVRKDPLLLRYRRWLGLMRTFREKGDRQQIAYPDFQAVSWLQCLKILVSKPEHTKAIDDLFVAGLRRAFGENLAGLDLGDWSIDWRGPADEQARLSSAEFRSLLAREFPVLVEEIERHLVEWILLTYPPEMKVPAFSSRKDGFVRLAPNAYSKRR
ncbi:MAG: hypothetical protein IPK26_02665 [Planctomycetes bacterium]|nr:hypothetical protein [Planctomycetota bacterium]